MHVVRDNEPMEFGVRFNRGDQQDAKWFPTSRERTDWIAQQSTPFGAGEPIKVVSFWNPKRLMK